MLRKRSLPISSAADLNIGMAAWSLFRKTVPDDVAKRSKLVELVMGRLTAGGRVRAEDAICGSAAIVGERCIDAAGDFPLHNHQFPPGQAVFSSRINELLCGDVPGAGIEAIPATSVFGMLRDRVNAEVYGRLLFPDLKSVFAGYAAGLGDSKMWGRVPVTVPSEHQPGIIPLQFAFETRSRVDEILEPGKADKHHCLEITVSALAALLNMIGRTLKPDVGLRLAFEITNGMAKTAPMTDSAFRAAMKKQKQS